jgi:hypothetical protein
MGRPPFAFTRKILMRFTRAQLFALRDALDEYVANRDEMRALLTPDQMEQLDAAALMALMIDAYIETAEAL